jgi:hypothetical protein
MDGQTQHFANMVRKKERTACVKQNISTSLGFMRHIEELRLSICSRTPLKITSLIRVSTSLAFTCFGHYLSSSEGIANNIKELLHICCCFNLSSYCSIIEGLTVA